MLRTKCHKYLMPGIVRKYCRWTLKTWDCIPFNKIQYTNTFKPLGSTNFTAIHAPFINFNQNVGCRLVRQSQPWCPYMCEVDGWSISFTKAFAGWQRFRWMAPQSGHSNFSIFSLAWVVSNSSVVRHRQQHQQTIYRILRSSFLMSTWWLLTIYINI